MDVNQAQFTEEQKQEIMNVHHSFTKLIEAEDYVGAVEFIDNEIAEALKAVKYDHAIQYIMMKKGYIQPA